MAHARARSRGRIRRRGSSAHQGGWLIFTRPEQHWFFRLLGWIVRVRAELTLITTTVTIYVILKDQFGPEPVLIGIGVTVFAVAVVPASRRYVIRRFWCVLTRHRVRACMVQTFTMARENGRMPLLLWSRPSTTGEHLTVWLPAGLAVKDLERVTDELATACWAIQVHVVGSEWRAALVHVYVARRELLSSLDLAPDVTDTNNTDTNGTGSGRHLYPVPDPGEERAALAALTPALPRSTEVPDAGTATPPAETSGTTTARAKGRTAGTTTRGEQPPVTGFGGQDISDYI